MRQVRSDVPNEIEALLLCLDQDDLANRRQEGGQGNHARFEPQFARLDLGDIQHFIDQSQQVLATLVDHGQAIALALSQGRVASEDLCVPQNGIQGRTQLVAHGCEKLALGTTRRLGYAAGTTLQFRLPALGDVEYEGHALLLRALQKRPTHHDGYARTVSAQKIPFLLGSDSAHAQLLDRLPIELVVLGRSHGLPSQFAAQQSVARITGQP